MTRRLAAALALVAAMATAAPKLNLIAIVTDDQARWTVGCYGGKELPTPNMDRLAASGARFANAFVHTPVCSPSRGAYLTGLLGTELGYTDWLDKQQGKSQGVRPEQLSWPTVLQQNGYTTALIGKWHVGEGEASLPWHNGLTRFTGNLGGGWATKDIKFIDETGGTFSSTGFSVEVCTDLAMKFMGEQRDQPFALLLHYREPHEAYIPMPEPDMASSRQADIQVPSYPKLKKDHAARQRRDYYASIAAIDRQLGRLLDYLEQTGLADHTVVMFTSDHGYNIGEHGIQYKGNGVWITEDRFHIPRPNMLDTSLRVPLLIRHPTQGKPGIVVEEMVANSDTAASVLGLLGIERPTGLPARSRDYAPAIRGQPLPADRFPPELFGQYDLVNCADKAHMRMMRTDRWKLVLYLDDLSRSELYDLQTDPGELENLYADPAMAETVRTLTGKIRAQMKAINDPRLAEVPAT